MNQECYMVSIQALTLINLKVAVTDGNQNLVEPVNPTTTINYLDWKTMKLKKNLVDGKDFILTPQRPAAVIYAPEIRLDIVDVKLLKSIPPTYQRNFTYIGSIDFNPIKLICKNISESKEITLLVSKYFSVQKFLYKVFPFKYTDTFFIKSDNKTKTTVNICNNLAISFKNLDEIGIMDGMTIFSNCLLYTSPSPRDS